MKKLFKPANIAFYFLMLIVFFFAGIFAAGIANAGKDQMLAGGAIVLFWGVLVGFIAFILSFIIVRYLNHRILVRCNWILFILLLIAYGVTHYRYQERQRKRGNTNLEEKQQGPQTPTISPIAMYSKSSLIDKNAINSNNPFPHNSSSEIGIGFFKPNYFDYNTLYFYGNINHEKMVMGHMPVDSVVFSTDRNGNPSTSYAPPWLYPAHLKLDYGIIIFKVMGIGQDFVKVEVNQQTGQDSYLDKNKGEFITWPEFLLSVNSVEFIDKNMQTVYSKPMEQADEVLAAFKFMQPLLVESDWMYVKLVDENLTEKGKGWIRWKKGDSLQIMYSLLS